MQATLLAHDHVLGRVVPWLHGGAHAKRPALGGALRQAASLAALVGQKNRGWGQRPEGRRFDCMSVQIARPARASLASCSSDIREGSPSVQSSIVVRQSFLFMGWGGARPQQYGTASCRRFGGWPVAATDRKHNARLWRALVSMVAIALHRAAGRRAGPATGLYAPTVTRHWRMPKSSALTGASAWRMPPPARVVRVSLCVSSPGWLYQQRRVGL